MSGQILKYRDKLKFKSGSKSKLVFDPIRKKYVVLTPEEFVRQLFILFLITELKIPVKHIAVERQIKINNKNHRFDILVFNNEANPKLIVECKSHKVSLSDAVAIQVSKYNIALKAKYLCITNGIQTMFFEVDYINQTIKSVEISQINI